MSFRHAPPIALRLLNALAWSWILRGRLREAVRSLDLALAAPARPPGRRPGGPGSRLLAGELVDVAALDPNAPARARLFLGFAGTDLLQPAISEQLVDDALAKLRAAGDTWGLAAALSAQSGLWMYDVGHHGQTFNLTCTALGLGPVPDHRAPRQRRGGAARRGADEEFAVYLLAAGPAAQG